MNSSIKSVVAGLFLLSSTVGANAVTIDFEGGAAGSAIDAFYAGLGATFSNGTFQDNFGLAGSAGAQGMGDATDTINTPYNPEPGNPIIITFSSAVSAFDIIALDVGGAARGSMPSTRWSAGCWSISTS